jgi:hypothetical protein
MYKLLKNSLGEISAVLRDDGWNIPMTLDNTDYQVYLKWVEDGGVPTPADE